MEPRPDKRYSLGAPQHSASNPAAVVALTLGLIAAIPMLALEGYFLLTSTPSGAATYMALSVIVFPWPVLFIPALLGVGFTVAALRRSRRDGTGVLITRWAVAVVVLALVALGFAVWLALHGCGPPDGC